MEKEIWVALIAAITSVIGAAFTWLQASRANRQTASTSLQLAHLTSELEKRKKALELATSESKPMEDVLDAVWRDLQTIKDVIGKVADHHEYDRSAANADVKDAVNRVASRYADFGGAMPATAQRVWHDAKSTATAASLLVPRLLNQATIGPTDADRLRAIHHELTERQTSLANERQMLRERFVRRVLELL